MAELQINLYLSQPSEEANVSNSLAPIQILHKLTLVARGGDENYPQIYFWWKEVQTETSLTTDYLIILLPRVETRFHVMNSSLNMSFLIIRMLYYVRRPMKHFSVTIIYTLRYRYASHFRISAMIPDVILCIETPALSYTWARVSISFPHTRHTLLSLKYGWAHDSASHLSQSPNGLKVLSLPLRRGSTFWT